MYQTTLIWLPTWAYRLRNIAMSGAVRRKESGLSHVLMSTFPVLRSKKTTKTCAPENKYLAMSPIVRYPSEASCFSILGLWILSYPLFTSLTQKNRSHLGLSGEDQ